MKRLLLVVAVGIVSYTSKAQVGIGNTDPKSSLDISASDVTSPSNTDGILIPRINDFPVTDPGADQDGMLVFVTGAGSPAKGFYYWDQGTTSWVVISGASSDADWYITGTTNSSTTITDNIVTQGSVTVGTDLSGFPNSKFFVKSDVTSDIYPIRISPEGTPASSATVYNLYNTDTSLTPSGAFNYYALYNNFTSTHTGSTSGLYNNFSASGGAEFGVYNLFNSISGTYGMRNEFTGTTSNSASFFGIENRLLSSSTYSGTVYGISNTLQAEGNGARYGLFNSISGSGTGDKYGTYTNIPSASGGQHFGIYSDVQSATGFAGFFVGRTSFGTDPVSGRYLMPTTDGTFGQVMTTNGAGQLTFTNPTTDTKNTLDGAYDEGGAGAGRTIIADNGPVVINGTDGFWVTGTHGTGIAFSVTADLSTSFFNPGTSVTRSGFASGSTWSLSNQGIYSVAMGYSPLASGIASTGFGYLTEASGDRSTAMGNGTVAPSFAEIALGNFNTTYVPTSTGSYNSADRLFSIGNGINASNRSNALSIYKDGTININDAYNMPLTDGTSGQVMATNGSGQLSFINPGTDLSSFALAKMSMSADQTLPAFTYTKLNFDTTEFDIGSNFNAASNRFIVSEPGYYRIDASMAHLGNMTNPDSFTIAIYVNGSVVKYARFEHHGSGPVHRSVSTIEQLSNGDYIEIYGHGTSSLTISSSTIYTTFEVERIR